MCAPGAVRPCVAVVTGARAHMKTTRARAARAVRSVQK